MAITPVSSGMTHAAHAPSPQPASQHAQQAQQVQQARNERTERPNESEKTPAATVYQAAPPKPTVNETGQTIGTIINVTA